ncbi:hypothetical protein DYB37_008678 [Aphanomyces astaci]|uniref:Protein ENHANCED DISEASE RESISTANCE 2 C-terminal domain-containing protein n=2 Tax=Aphanomyces astaci TaxID=112090 RepID=A0A3R6WGX5_APHAT|nr:hypothetical protein DYB35_008319 [Aphanomyces astaci]RHZ19208.1 hypothetical protein DYB37_008678 [Aphanomyces astaci]
MSSCFVAIDHHYIRCFNSQFSSTSQQQRRRITPVLALLLLLVAATVVRFVVSIPYQYYNLHYVRPHKPTDDTIQAHILVDVAPGQKAKPPPHLRGDTFYIEPWTGQCKNTVHGLVYATDARGITCKRSSLMPTGCCGDDVRFSCSTCDVEAPHCCLAYERCVSCCMGPTNTALVHAFLAHADPKHPVYGQPPSDLTLFGFCTFRCRTSSAGVQHQNSYRSAKKHCYGVHRPLKELDVVNSDESALHNATTSPPRHDEYEPPMDGGQCELIWVDVFQGDRSKFFHISQRPESVVRHFTELYPHRELFVLNILLPGTPDVTYAQYFALRPDGVTDAFSKLWRAFMDGTDDFRNARLKLIPRVVEGPWMIRKAVGAKPFILANALEVQWFRGKNYLEAVVDVSSDSIAKKVTSMCRMCVASLVVDMALVVEGKSEDELPEAILGCANLSLTPRVCRSARQARRINQAIQSKGESSDEEEEVTQKSSSAGFQYLLDDSDDSDVSSNDDKDSNDEVVIAKPKCVAQASPPASSKKSKKKQAKKKSVNNAHAEVNDDVDDLLHALASQANLDDEEKPAFLPPPAMERNALLAVNAGALNADKEMKRFGDNKSFYRALFFLMRHVGRRGCVRSAFEIAKLIWSLDPKGDPLHVLLCLDYYALSARQCQFVVDLFESNTEIVFRTDKAVAVPSLAPVTVAALPGLQMSVALARYLLGDVARATVDLASTLSKFPQVLVPLTEKCGISTTSSTFLLAQDVICSAVFANAPHLDDHGVVSHLLHIYVTRHASLWKVNDIQSFLLQAAVQASASYNRGTFVTELPPLVHKYKRAMSPGTTRRVADTVCSLRRTGRLDFSDEVTTLPPDHPMMMQPGARGGDADGMLDLDNMDPAMIAQLQAQLEAEQARNGGNLPADAHPLLLFLQTLLPWNRLQQPGAQRPANFDENPVYQPADE